MVIDRRESARVTRSDRDGHAIAHIGEGVGDVGSADVDAHGLVVLLVLPEPHDEDDGHGGRVGRAVGEGEGVPAVGADPGPAVGLTSIDALVGEAGALEVLAVFKGEVGDAVDGAGDGGCGEGVDVGEVDPGVVSEGCRGGRWEFTSGRR